MVSIIQVNVTGRSVNMIQHNRHFGDNYLLNHCYICIYIYAFGICAAVDFSYDMTYSGTGTMLHYPDDIARL